MPRLPLTVRPRSGGRRPPLARMRRYVTWSFVALAVFTTLVLLATLVAERASPWLLAASAAAGVLVTVHSFFWEGSPPVLLTAGGLVVSYGVWLAVPLGGHTTLLLFFFGLTVGYLTTTPPFASWRWAVVAVVAALVPVVVTGADEPARLVGLSLAVTIGLLSLYAICRLNRYGFDLYLEIDSARETQSELAVMRERYRFSADLHDIQGQALHVSRLQLQLADKTLDRDPVAARQHLREAEQLIVQTIAETRRLAYGERTLTLAGELANSTELIRAAGIVLDVTGRAPVGHPADDLFGHTVREATTNLLRHAQAEHVTIDLADDAVVVVNDGASTPIRGLSGLARLADRFAEVGGTLTTSHHEGVFRTEARAPRSRSAE
ncbi:sensor histidine kinase [Frigoribacterium sp. VKM Ac-2836]|uniref:sensor histidine kinase n=1 Tax=Frigoribacterium sp. VKM Ac-2836 TaxID=2739014 RepID=UPI001566A3FC|nr:histidine kinase [Frigoribacterium sp. VKM Ac-2836]NRD25079.1 sensor histidine kinase [Frigoribacterium sp. VKM Ac-2836]